MSSFVNRNLVAIVMIPVLIGIHYGWDRLQYNETLVKKDERTELPIVVAGKQLLGINKEPRDENPK